MAGKNLDEVLGAPGREDYIERRYRLEYSEETKDMLRSFGKPAWENEEDEASTLDGAADLDTYYNFSLKMPPKEYEDAQEACKDEIADLDSLKEEKLPEEYVNSIRYRKSLMEGTSEPDVKWLKLKAYHRGTALLRAREAAERAPEAGQERLQAMEVPLDVVPAELLDLNPAELLERGKKSSRTMRLSLLNQPFSEDSEWDPNWQSPSYISGPIMHQLGSFLRSQLAASPASSAGTQLLGVAEEGSLEGAEAPSFHAYQPEYIRYVELQVRDAKLRRRHKGAFWVALSVVSAAFVCKSLKKLLTKRRPKPGKMKASV